MRTQHAKKITVIAAPAGALLVIETPKHRQVKAVPFDINVPNVFRRLAKDLHERYGCEVELLPLKGKPVRHRPWGAKPWVSPHGPLPPLPPELLTVQKPSGPTGLRELGVVYSNADHAFMDNAYELLRAGDAMGDHVAWDFLGKIWFADGKFHEEVWQSHAVVDLFTGDTLREVVEATNAKYGSG